MCTLCKLHRYRVWNISSLFFLSLWLRHTDDKNTNFCVSENFYIVKKIQVHEKLSGRKKQPTPCDTSFIPQENFSISVASVPFLTTLSFHTTFCSFAFLFTIFKFSETLKFGISVSASGNHQNYKQWRLEIFHSVKKIYDEFLCSEVNDKIYWPFSLFFCIRIWYNCIYF